MATGGSAWKGGDEDEWAPKKQQGGVQQGGPGEDEGRILSLEEQRALLKRSDEATTRAQVRVVTPIVDRVFSARVSRLAARSL